MSFVKNTEDECKSLHYHSLMNIHVATGSISLIRKGKIKSPWLRKLWIIALEDVVNLRRADNVVKTGTNPSRQKNDPCKVLSHEITYSSFETCLMLLKGNVSIVFCKCVLTNMGALSTKEGKNSNRTLR